MSAPDIAEVERLVAALMQAADSGAKGFGLSVIPLRQRMLHTQKARTALIDAVRAIVAERDEYREAATRLSAETYELAAELSAAQQPVGEAWHLDEAEASLLHQLSSPDDEDEHSPLTLRVGHVRDDDGTVKFGLLCEYAEYPEEGPTLLVERGHCAASCKEPTR